MTFPPLSNIEVVGEGRVMEVEGKEVLVVPATISVNLKTLNREQLVSFRKTLLLSALRNYVYEIGRNLNRLLDAYCLARCLKSTDYDAEDGRAVVQKILEECERTVQRHADTEPEAYNNDDHMHHLALQEAAAMPAAALAKFRAFSETRQVSTGNFGVLSMAQWKAVDTSKRRNTYQAFLALVASRAEVDKERLRLAAEGLAVDRGLISESREQGSLDQTSGPDANTALIRAVASGRLEDVLVLLDAGCDIEAADAKGYTPLACCMVYGYEDIAAQLLLRAACLTSRTTLRQESLAFIACRFGRLVLLKVCVCVRDRDREREREYLSLIIFQKMYLMHIVCVCVCLSI